jgi:hypothetical protein
LGNFYGFAAKNAWKWNLWCRDLYYQLKWALELKINDRLNPLFIFSERHWFDAIPYPCFILKPPETVNKYFQNYSFSNCLWSDSWGSSFDNRGQFCCW